MLKIQLEKVRGYNFTGFIYRSDLTVEQLKLFPGAGEFIDVDGIFSVEFDDDEPIVTIDECMAHTVDIELALEKQDYDKIALQIEIERDHYTSDWVRDAEEAYECARYAEEF